MVQRDESLVKTQDLYQYGVGNDPAKSQNVSLPFSFPAFAYVLN